MTLHEDVDVKETAADVTEEKVEEPPTPAIAQPAHTSPDLSFASEVKSQNMIDGSRYMHITITFNSNRAYQSNIKESLPVGAAENHPVGGPDSGCQRQQDGWYDEGQE